MGPGTGRISAPTLTPADTLADLMGAGRAALGWAQDNPLDAAALAVSPVPVVGDIAGLANDVRHYVTDPESRTWGNAVLTLIGLLPFMPSAAGALRGVAGESAQAPEILAKKGVYTYDPPSMPHRPFEEDYPHGATADPSGRLTTDRDGRPINAPFVAGRRVLGGVDEGLQAGDTRAILRELARRYAEVTTDRRLIGSDAGRLITEQGPNGLERRVYLHGDLTPEQFPRVYAHETAHVIDDIAGKLRTDGLVKELKPVYDRLNRPGGNQPVTPEAMGYSGDRVPREYIAEAIRAYMVNPNYLKTVAPKTAARIREFVNANPQMSSVVQFNSLLGAGLLGAGVRDQDTETPPAPEQR